MDNLRIPGSLGEVGELVDARYLRRMQQTTIRAVEALLADSRRRERRQCLFNERLLRELADLRSQVRGLSAHGSPGFPRFRYLPYDVRIMIWSFTLSQRVFPNVDPSNRFGSRLLRAPVISQVSQESRVVALRYGRYYAFKDGTDPSDFYSERARVQWSWFNPGIDILCLGKLAQCAAAEKAARTLFLECRPDEPAFLGPQVTCRFHLGKIDHYQNLEVAYVGFRLQISRGLSSAAVADIFRGKEAVMIELDDDGNYFHEIRRLYAILKAEEGNGRCASTVALHSDSLWVTAQGFKCRFKQELPDLQTAIVQSRAQHMSAAGMPVENNFLSSRGCPNEKLEWVRAAISSVNLRPGKAAHLSEDVTNHHPVLLVLEDASASLPDASASLRRLLDDENSDDEDSI